VTIVPKPHQNFSSKTRDQLPIISFLSRFFSTTSIMSAAKTKAEKIIDENAVAVFSKSFCPYCKATKATLDDLGAKYFSIELDQVDDGAAIQAALKEINGQSSVPNIYIKKQHIGGNSDLQAKKGDLPELLKDAGAI